MPTYDAAQTLKGKVARRLRIRPGTARGWRGTVLGWVMASDNSAGKPPV
jgi:hypothetical protein